MSSTPAADLIDKHNAARKRIAELEQELLEERASYEAENQRLHDALSSIRTCMADADVLHEIAKQALEEET